MKRYVSFVSGRRTKWAVLAFWVVVAGLIAPFSGKLESVEKNESSSYLPGSAESTKVLAITTSFQGGELAPAVVIYDRESGLTKADLQRAATDYCALLQLDLKGTPPPPPGPCPPQSPPAGEGSTSQWTPPTPSADGKAVIYAIPIKAGGDSNIIIDDVAAIRSHVGEGTGGLVIKVTGGAGFSADAVKVFGNIDTTLLYWTAAIVAVLLLITYRSPVLWLIPLLTVAFAEQCARAVAYGLTQVGVTVNGLTASVLVVLVFGAGTDYALLIVARYREELRRHEDRHESMAFAMRRTAPAILASGLTVACGLLCLFAASLNSNRGLGPVSAIGVLMVLFAMLTLLPALLVILGRWVFWPFVPHFGSADHTADGPWARMGRQVSRAPRVVWITTTLALGCLALGLLRLDTNLSQLNSFRSSVDSIEGQKLLARSFPSGAAAPTDVVVRPAVNVGKAMAAAKATPGVAQVFPPATKADTALFEVILRPDPFSAAAFDTVDALRTNVKRAAGEGAMVGGQSAIQLDANRAAVRDFKLIAPLILLVVLIILGLLLRAILAPVLLIGTVILSFLAAMGASVLVFEFVFKFQGMDPGIPLICFVFLVALGVDYNIFLMARVREEALHSGTRPGMRKALAVTGGVITSAGFVLAGTFSVLGVLPLVTLTEVGFIVAFGVLLDTLVVRSVLVPALTLDVGRHMWWPSELERTDGDHTVTEQPAEAVVGADGGTA